jgi:hypothetical protein
MGDVNKYAGSSFEEFLKSEFAEPLSKSCPRCGGKSANPSNPQGRCSACLKKLAANKKKVGHYLHEHKVADDALKRQDGKTKTASKKTKGRGSRAAIIKKVHEGEKKAGQVLSPDRKSNESGYSSSNVRMVPPKLNRGRHHVDGKKLRAWQKRLKKTDLSDEQIYTMVLCKAQETNDTALLSLLEDMHPNDLVNFINNNDDGADLPLKKSELLDKAAPALKQQQTPQLPIPYGEHTVEIHPHIDHLKRIKGVIQESGKPSLKVAHLKQKGIDPNFIQKHVPKDAHGNITPEGIDKHIEKLPKHKVVVKVAPYKMGAQLHHPDSKQHVLSVQLHPETKLKMDPATKNAWDRAKHNQHLFEGISGTDEGSNTDDPKGFQPVPHDQVGWARIDANAKPGHWHVDEIQSDFQNKDKIKSTLGTYGGYDIVHDVANDKQHPLHEKAKKAVELASKLDIFRQQIEHAELRNKYLDEYLDTTRQLEEHQAQKDAKNIEPLHEHLSHGHDDPQHMIHSAVNELGRKYGVNSTSMDTPEDQAKQSNLREFEDSGGYGDASDYDYDEDAYNKEVDRYLEEHFKPEDIQKEVSEQGNPYLKSAYNKVSHDELGDAISGWLGSDRDVLVALQGNVKEFNNLSGPEKDALHEFIITQVNRTPDKPDLSNHIIYGENHPDYGGDDAEDDPGKAALPVHQMDTYDKRPRKLGMKEEDKAKVLGEENSKPGEKVQYSKLYKKVIAIRNLMKEYKNESKD